MQLRVNVTMTGRNRAVSPLGTIDAEVARRVALFSRQVNQIRTASGKTATNASRAAVRRHRPTAPPRAGRKFDPLETTIEWRPVSGLPGDSDVGINQSVLKEKAGHWLVQNIGTGNSAVVHVGGRPNPTGRPTKDATYIREIPSQIGRRISAGLVFATGPNGTFVPPSQGQRGRQQLQLRKNVGFNMLLARAGKTPLHAWSRTRSQAGIRIGHEIKPQRFIQAGATAGFREYRESILTAARSAFERTPG